VSHRRRLAAGAVLAVAGLALVVAGCGRATPTPTGVTSTSVPDDAAATCAASELGATTAAPVKPGPTSMGLPSLPQEGDLPMGRYSSSPLLTIDAPCWRRLPPLPDNNPLALARSDVPTDRLTIARAYLPAVDPCDPSSSVDADVASIAAWFRALPGVTVEDRPSMRIDDLEATVLRLTSTAAGGCAAPAPGLGGGSPALFDLPFVAAREPGQAADVTLVGHPTTGGVTVIVTASADAAALDRFGPFALRLMRSLMFDRPVP
jgi:hypothetical protein